MMWLKNRTSFVVDKVVLAGCYSIILFSEKSLGLKEVGIWNMLSSSCSLSKQLRSSSSFHISSVSWPQFLCELNIPNKSSLGTGLLHLIKFFMILEITCDMVLSSSLNIGQRTNMITPSVHLHPLFLTPLALLLFLHLHEIHINSCPLLMYLQCAHDMENIALMFCRKDF